jgi:hypothetical protein
MAVPTIYCENRKGQYVFYCTGCRKCHYHGKGDGLRLSHCRNPKSPLYDKDYYLKLHPDPQFRARRPKKSA